MRIPFAFSYIYEKCLATLTRNAVTLYGPGSSDNPCDPDAAPGSIVADPSRCYNTTWAYYSIDMCLDLRTSTLTTAVTSAVSSSTFSRSASLHSSSQAASPASSSGSPANSTAHKSTASTGVVVGATIGGVAFGVIVATIGIISFKRYRRVRQSRPPRYSDSPPPLQEIYSKEASGEDVYLGNFPPGSRGEAQELPTHGIAEVQGDPVVELPGWKRKSGNWI